MLGVTPLAGDALGGVGTQAASASKISVATGNFTAASTWAICDPGTEQDSEAGSTSLVIGASGTSATFTPGAITIQGFALKFQGWNGNIATTGTVTVALLNVTDALTVATFTMNVTDLPSYYISNYPYGGWQQFSFAPVTLLAGKGYAIKITNDNANGQAAFFTNGVANNWSRELVTTTNAVPVSGDKLMICGLRTAGAPTPVTVTMDNTNNVMFGSTTLLQSISVSSFGILSYGTNTATNYYLRVQGSMVVYAGGTFNIGTSAAPIPSSSKAVLEFNCIAIVDSGLTVHGNFNAYGYPKFPANPLTNATNASPIQITSAAHGLVVGERVTIGGVGGNTAANGTWEVASVVDANNFTIGAINGAYPGPGVGTSTGNAAYTSGGTWSRLAYSKMNLPRGGLCSITNGSSAVLGIEGQSFVGLTGTINLAGANYTIASVTDATHLTLTANFTGTTANTTGSYAQWTHAATAATVTVLSTAGWSAGDVLVFPTTDRTPARSEAATIQSVDSATQVTLTTALQNYHGGTAPVQVEIGNLTRNVVIRGISPTLQSYIIFNLFSVATCNHIEFTQIGSNVSGKNGIMCQCQPPGSVSISYSSAHDSTVTSSYGFYISNNSNTYGNITIANNVTWSIANSHIMAFTTQYYTWIVDGNLCVRTTDANANTITIYDLGGTLTNNVVSGATGMGFYTSEPMNTTVPWFGNTAHGCGSQGFNFGASGAYYVSVANYLAWRNVTGFLYAALRDSTFQTICAFGNTNNHINTCANTLFSNLTGNGDISFANTTGLFPFGNTNVSFSESCRVESSTFGVASGFLAANIYDLQYTNGCTGDITFLNSTFSSVSLPATFTTSPNVVIRSQQHNQVVGNHRWWGAWGTGNSDTAIYKTASPSLRMTPAHATNKLVMNLGKRAAFMVPVTSGAATAISVQIRTSSAADGAAYNGNPPRLMLRNTVGLNPTSISVLATFGGTNPGTWATMTGITPVATANGVWECFVDCDGTAGWINVDDWRCWDMPVFASVDGMGGAVTLSGTDVTVTDNSPSARKIQLALAPLSPSPAGSYVNANISVDSKGRVTAASGSVPAGTFYPWGNPATINLTAINPAYSGWRGGFAAGQWLYLIPANNGTFVRVNSDFSTVQALDLTTVNANFCKFSGGCTDGRYAYLAPSGKTNSGLVVRVDLQSFTTSNVNSLNLAASDASLGAVRGCCTDGLGGYCHNIKAYIARFTLSNFTPAATQVVGLGYLMGNLASYSPGPIETDGKNLYTIWGAGSLIYLASTPPGLTNSRVLDVTAYGTGGQSLLFVGNYIYYLINAKLVRISPDFTSQTVLDLSSLSGGKNFFGLAAGPQGRYLYLGPTSSSGLVARVDLADFQTVAISDLSVPPYSISGGNGSFQDGRYGYHIDPTTGQLIRYQQFDGGHF